MIWCLLQYTLAILNVLVYASFCVYFLCCQPGYASYDTKIKALILMPLATSFLTAVVAIYYLVVTDGDAQCIYFGTPVAMYAIDFESQIIFIVGTYFLFSMNVVVQKVKKASAVTQSHNSSSSNGASITAQLIRSAESIEREEKRIKRRMWIFIALFCAVEAPILALKFHIYSVKHKRSDPISGLEIAFVSLNGVRSAFNITLIVIFLC